MEEIEVMTLFDSQGSVTPLSFVWQGHSYVVDSTGRRWRDEKGQHILVMIPGRRVFELLFVPYECRWYLTRIGAGRMFT